MRLLTRTRVLAALGALAIAAGAFAVGVTAASGSPSRSRPHRSAARAAPVPRVTVYGDSLVLQSSPYLAGIGQAFGVRVLVRAFSGTAPCDFLPVLRKDLAARPPDLVVFAFSGNSVATCMLDPTGRPLTGLPMLVKYRTDTETAADMTTKLHRPFLVASPPAPEGKMAIWKSLDDVYRQIAASLPGVQYVDAGQDIAPGGQFSATQQCLPFETKIPQAQGSCNNPDSRIPVRGADGGHFCGDSGPAAAVLCPEYSSGAMRYAINLVSAAKLILDAPAARAGI